MGTQDAMRATERRRATGHRVQPASGPNPVTIDLTGTHPIIGPPKSDDQGMNPMFGDENQSDAPADLVFAPPDRLGIPDDIHSSSRRPDFMDPGPGSIGMPQGNSSRPNSDTLSTLSLIHI